jgi:hypothetical protein
MFSCHTLALNHVSRLCSLVLDFSGELQKDGFYSWRCSAFTRQGSEVQILSRLPARPYEVRVHGEAPETLSLSVPARRGRNNWYCVPGIPEFAEFPPLKVPNSGASADNVKDAWLVTSSVWQNRHCVICPEGKIHYT